MTEEQKKELYDKSFSKRQTEMYVEKLINQAKQEECNRIIGEIEKFINSDSKIQYGELDKKSGFQAIRIELLTKEDIQNKLQELKTNQ